VHCYLLLLKDYRSGNRLNRDEFRVIVDLDAEEAAQRRAQGLPTRQARPDAKPRKDNIHTIYIRWTRAVDFNHLQAFLDGQASWSSECIDTINFLDHVMREGPSRNYTQIKKSFFQRGENRFDLGGGVEAFKGVFSSLRPVLNDRFQKCLSVNVDVANGTFWRAQEILRAVCQVFGCSPPRKYLPSSSRLSMQLTVRRIPTALSRGQAELEQPPVEEGPPPLQTCWRHRLSRQERRDTVDN
jgi:eukaryotic translation initiation factor 2C